MLCAATVTAYWCELFQSHSECYQLFALFYQQVNLSVREFCCPPMSSCHPKGSNQVKWDQVTLIFWNSHSTNHHTGSSSTACNMLPQCRGAQHVRSTFLLLSTEEYHVKDKAVHSDGESILFIWHAILSESVNVYIMFYCCTLNKQFEKQSLWILLIDLQFAE
jgi:hypothetical protein